MLKLKALKTLAIPLSNAPVLYTSFLLLHLPLSPPPLHTLDHLSSMLFSLNTLMFFFTPSLPYGRSSLTHSVFDPLYLSTGSTAFSTIYFLNVRFFISNFFPSIPHPLPFSILFPFSPCLSFSPFQSCYLFLPVYPKSLSPFQSCYSSPPGICIR